MRSQQLGQLDNTLVIYIVGDNGASAEGTLQGSLNEMAMMNGIPEDYKEVLKHKDDLGTWKTHNHYPVGWAHAMDTPFQWTKQIASHYGGTRNGMVISWPARIKDEGGIRSQWHHVIDIVPTILEVTGVQQPSVVNGVAQKPIEGVSMAYTFDDPKAPSTRRTQYFEMFGNRGIYHDGWVACTTPHVAPWEDPFNARQVDVISGYKWELYNVADDFSEAVNLADKYPDKLQELQLLFYAEAAKYNVLPLDDSKVARMDVALRPSLTRGRTEFTYYGSITRIPEGAAPDMKNKSFRITANVVLPKGGEQGIVRDAGRTVRRLRADVQGRQADFPLQPGKRRALQHCGQGRSSARQAHGCFRLQVRRRRHRQGRHRHDQRGRQAGRCRAASTHTMPVRFSASMKPSM